MALASGARRTSLPLDRSEAAAVQGRLAFLLGALQRDAARGRQLRSHHRGQLHRAMRLSSIPGTSDRRPARPLHAVKPRTQMTGWEIVVGIETHAQLATRSKMFSGASTAF